MKKLVARYQRLLVTNDDLYLGTERGLLVEVSLHEITELARGDLALSADTDTAGVPDDLAHHVFRLRGRRVRVLLPLPANRPFCDVIRPDVRRYAGWCLAKTEKEIDFKFSYIYLKEIYKSIQY